LDRDVSAGFDLNRTATDQRESDFEERTLGGTIRFGYNLSEFLKQDWSYSLYQDDIFNVDDNASIAILQSQGKSIVSTVGQTLTYDRRDNVFDPHDGYVLRFRTDVAGLGGDIHYLRNRLQAAYYYPVTDDVTAGLQGDIGYVFGLGENLRVADSFFLGGNTFRGFRTSGVGPRDTDTNDSLGGKLLAVGTAELAFPLGLPEEYGIRGRVFSDFGTLTDSDFNTPGQVDTGNLRVSVGGGLTWRSPFGPLSVDIGFPILKDPEDRRELFRFNAGARF
jgi:outer membrane protein insertion porin family